MIYVSNYCAFCIHQRNEMKDNWIPTCDAFPDGKPLDWDENQVKPQEPCNNGIGFERKEENKDETAQ